MNRFHHKILSLFFVLPSLLTVATLSSNQKEEIKVNASEERLVTNYNSTSLTTSSTYQKYENDHWLMTMGSSNGIGASNTYSSRLTLGVNSNLMAFNPSINSTSKYLSALIFKQPISSLSSISLSRGNSYGGFLSTNVFLVKSSSLDGNYDRVTTIDSISTTLKNYSFPPIKENCYYALVFYNPNGSFIIGGVNVNFYTKEVVSYSKVTSDSQLYFGATYTLVDETSQKAISIYESAYGFSGLSTNIIDSQIEDEDTLLKFKLGVGLMIDTYSLQTINGSSSNRYLAINDNAKLATSVNNFEASAFILSIDSSSTRLYRNDQYLTYDLYGDEFIFSSAQSNISLYILNEPIDHFEEVRIFSDQVNTRGIDAKGHCDETYQFLNSVYLRLSEEGINIFLTSMSEDDINAKHRMVYLENWHSYYQQARTKGVVTSSILIFYVMIGVSCLFLLFYGYISHRKRI